MKGQTTMVTGRMHQGLVIHAARKVKTCADGTVLYEPMCARMRRANVLYLQVMPEAEVSCTRCKTLIDTKPHLFT
jgi:hypothetical protein